MTPPMTMIAKASHSEMKPCIICKVPKELGEFYAHPLTSDGRMGKCKECHKENIRKNRELNKAHYLEYDKQRYKEQGHRYVNVEPQEYQRKWRAENRDKVRQHKHKRRILIEQSGAHYTAEEFLELCETFDNVCLCCGADDKPLTVDHVVPVSRGGSNNIENIQPLCRSCNSSKGVKEIDYREVLNEPR